MFLYEEKTINLTDVLLDAENPRHNIMESQLELLHIMLEDQKDKLVRLAKDIVEYGINPSDLTSVIKHDEYDDKYIVLEGNRRLVALTLLHTPSRLPETSTNSIKKQFNALHKKFIQNPINEIKCIVFNEKEAADHWRELKHTGENQGAGTVGWDATAKRRFEARRKAPSVELQIIDLILNEAELSVEESEAFKTISTTTVKRLINDPDIRKALGITKEGGTLKTDLTKEEIVGVLVDFFLPFATKEKKVTAVYHKDDRLDYLQKLPKEILPNLDNRTSSTWALSSPPEKTPPVQPSTTRKKPVTRSHVHPLKRKKLIPPGFALKIEPPRINLVYRELKDLDVDDYPNAVAVLLRVFFEISLDHFIDKNNVEPDPNHKLPKKLEKVAEHFKKNRTLTRDQLSPVKKAISSPHSIFSIDTFHSYVHNRFHIPMAKDLKISWDNMQPFIEKVWE